MIDDRGYLIRGYDRMGTTFSIRSIHLIILTKSSIYSGPSNASIRVIPTVSTSLAKRRFNPRNLGFYGKKVDKKMLPCYLAEGLGVQQNQATKQ